LPEGDTGLFYLIKEQFFYDSASHHHKKIKGVLQGFALHPKIKKIF
jgi:hypothetical protein